MSYPLAVALAMGLVLQAALAFAPDPGVGPGASGLPRLEPTFGAATGVFLHNALAVSLVAAGALLAAWTVTSHEAPRPRRRLLGYLALLGVAYWAYFVAGVDWLARDLDTPRPALTAALVHGYLEWPALLLPWAGVSFAVTAGRRLDLRLVGASCACSLGLLGAAALLEALVVPGLLGRAA